MNHPIKEFIKENYYYNSNNQKELGVNENSIKNTLSNQDRLMKKFSSIEKYLGKNIFFELKRFYLSFII